MRLFVSYARLDKPYCIQIIQFLNAHEVWFDQRFYAGDRWWDEILRRLEWCEGFVYLLSPASVASEYCQREFNLALQLQRQIFPILIHDQTTIPEEVSSYQYVDLTHGITPDATAMLLNSIHRSEINNRPKQMSLDNVPRAQVELPVVNSASVISVAAAAMEKGQFDQAVFLFKQAKAKGFTSRFINIDKLLKEAERQLEDQTKQAQRDLDYRQIGALIRVKATREMGCEALSEYLKEYPTYDPENLVMVCGNGVSATTAAKRASKDKPPALPDPAPMSASVARPLILDEPLPFVMPALPSKIITSDLVALNTNTYSMPLLDWVYIPEGSVTIEDTDVNGSRRLKSYKVPSYEISRYPITNRQYQEFIDASDGYANSRWWQFSPEAEAWRTAHPHATPSRFQGDERPRETVNWYDAIAFCNWLGSKLGFDICLPTSEEWYRAAKGDTDNRYPWGVEFDKDRCNTRESELKMTTPVTRYSNGVSPFGVWDMAGNIWEWSLSAKDGSNGSPVAGEAERAVHGGAYHGTYDRARIPFRYYLKPGVSYATIGFRVVRRV